MKMCFDFFLNYDISSWDYRKFPVTNLRRKIIACSRDVNLRFLKYFVQHVEIWELSKQELFMYWNQFVEEHGVVHHRRDLNYVASSFELCMNCDYDEKQGCYNLKKADVLEKLRALFGEEIILER